MSRLYKKQESGGGDWLHFKGSRICTLKCDTLAGGLLEVKAVKTQQTQE